MAEPVSIKRRTARHSELGFENLRREAIRLIQQVSGKVWTDFNVHDPGITILEQLIYALTELNYRCDFAVEDYLAGEDGRIDLEAQALHPAADIFPCRPTTADDYRKMLLNAFPEIDNIWVSQLAEDAAPGGLYRFSVKLDSGLERARRESIIDDIQRLYCGARNLCEDLAEVSIVENVEYELRATIEVDSARYPADILADIYFACSRRIASSAVITNYEQLDLEAETLDQLFEGPFTDHGFFESRTGLDEPSGFAVSALFSIVNAVDGVEQIQQLCLSRDGETIYDRLEAGSHPQAYDLAVPDTAAAVRVKLINNGRVLPVSISDLVARYEELRFKYYASRSTEQDLSLLYQPIAGAARPLNRYFSIQNQFPVNYGVNRLGVAATAPVDVRARVRQLQGYLAIFEQYLLNFLANLDAVDDLFSPRTEPRRSYATQTLDPQQLHDLGSIYPLAADRVMGGIMAEFDNFSDRKSRLLDYLLALYGERFSQHSLRHFNYYYSKEQLDDVILANKVAFLQAIVELGRDRAAAPDYRAEPTHQTSGLALRAAMLLGFDRPRMDSLTAMLIRQGIRLCSQHEYQQKMANSDALQLIDTAVVEGGEYSQPALMVVESDMTPGQLRAEFTLFDKELLSETLLRDGIDLSRYRVGRGGNSENFRLCFKVDEDHYWHLGLYSNKPAAVHAANHLRQFLLWVNRRSESLHVVEHILLRPQQSNCGADESDFYAFRISIILPGWSKRCHDREFRSLVRETVRLNVPAHVFAEFFWFDFEQMSHFEQRYQAWRDLKRSADADGVELDRRAGDIVDFLHRARQTQAEEEWPT